MTIQPDLTLYPSGPHPCMLSSLITTMQHIQVSYPGEEPNIFSDLDACRTENLKLLGAEFDGMTSSERRVFFSDKNNIDRFYYEPTFVYTFDFY